jgi:hypothetical protein
VRLGRFLGNLLLLPGRGGIWDSVYNIYRSRTMVHEHLELDYYTCGPRLVDSGVSVQLAVLIT